MVYLRCPKCNSRDIYIVNEVSIESTGNPDKKQYSVELNCGNCNWERQIVRNQDGKMPLFVDEDALLGGGENPGIQEQETRN